MLYTIEKIAGMYQALAESGVCHFSSLNRGAVVNWVSRNGHLIPKKKTSKPRKKKSNPL